MWRRAVPWGLLGLFATLPALAQAPAPAAPAPATVPTAKKVVTTVPAPAPTAPTPGAGTPAAPPDTVERARQGVVVVERQGKPLALGTVLDGDGRILTALSPLTNGNFLSARYHDGSVVALKLEHSDRGWDLALLVPVPTAQQTLKKTGVRAARQLSFVGLQTFALGPAPNMVSSAPTSLKLAAGLLGGDSTTLAVAYELAAKPTYVGAPIVNGTGEVVALVARACPAGSKAGCTPAPYAAPVGALKRFLQRAPAQATWLGIQAAAGELQGVRGVRVAAVTPQSPAELAGLRPGKDAQVADLIVAVDGTPVTNLTELNEAVRAHAVGDSIELLLFGMGRYRHVSVKPRPAPELVRPPYVAPKPTKPRTPNPYR
jgi:S1-C subfamily serine protease